jgi:hypothetical protein
VNAAGVGGPDTTVYGQDVSGVASSQSVLCTLGLGDDDGRSGGLIRSSPQEMYGQGASTSQRMSRVRKGRWDVPSDGFARGGRGQDAEAARADCAAFSLRASSADELGARRGGDHNRGSAPQEFASQSSFAAAAQSDAPLSSQGRGEVVRPGAPKARGADGAELEGGAAWGTSEAERRRAMSEAAGASYGDAGRGGAHGGAVAHHGSGAYGTTATYGARKRLDDVGAQAPARSRGPSNAASAQSVLASLMDAVPEDRELTVLNAGSRYELQRAEEGAAALGSAAATEVRGTREARLYGDGRRADASPGFQADAALGSAASAETRGARGAHLNGDLERVDASQGFQGDAVLGVAARPRSRKIEGAPQTTGRNDRGGGGAVGATPQAVTRARLKGTPPSVLTQALGAFPGGELHSPIGGGGSLFVAGARQPLREDTRLYGDKKAMDMGVLASSFGGSAHMKETSRRRLTLDASGRARADSSNLVESAGAPPGGVVLREDRSARPDGPGGARGELAPSAFRVSEQAPIVKHDKDHETLANPMYHIEQQIDPARRASVSAGDARGLVFLDRAPGFERVGGGAYPQMLAERPQVARVPDNLLGAPRIVRDQLLSFRSPQGAWEHEGREPSEVGTPRSARGDYSALCGFARTHHEDVDSLSECSYT